MWTCSKCATKLDDQFEVCWHCGTNKDGTEDLSFVSADDTLPIEDRAYDPIAEPNPGTFGPASGNPADTLDSEVVAAYEALSLMEAKFIADQLVSEGIPAMSDTQDMQDALGTLEGNPKVYVRAEDMPRARAWLETYESRRKLDPKRYLEP